MDKEVKKSKSSKKNIIESMAKFYKDELRTKHKWNFVIGIFLYFALLISFKTGAFSLESVTSFLAKNVNIYTEQTNIYSENVDVYSNTNSLNAMQQNNVKSNKEYTRFDAIKQQLALSAVTTISGLTPFVNIPVLVTLVYPLTYAYNVASLGIIETILISLMAIIEIFIVTLIVSVGMYWCKMSTNHFRYNESTSFTLSDVRLQFNEAMKKDEKVEEIKKRMDAKYEKMKKLNEKTNYKAIFEFFILATILLCICTLITGV